ncbi:peptidase C11 [Rhizophagus clarus]|uniref:Peptidase C11 n=1 Tax=Rhizophagus clarus TaxID=94130 RepID=A0A8H3M1R5_9GLOM|nr:peptidase C11 [Rhizophagus clarus]
MDFSKKFNYYLCSIYYNLLAKLKKSKPLLTNQSKTPKSSSKSDQATRLTKSKLQGSNNNSLEEIGVNEINKIGETDKVEETDEIEQIDNMKETDEIEETDEVEKIDEIEETDKVEEIDEIEFERDLTTNKDKVQILEYKNLEIVDVDVIYDLDNLEIEELDEDDMLNKISFKLVIKREENQIDELVLHNNYVIIYKHVQDSGIGTHLSDEKDWKMFLKEYQKLSSNEKEIMIIASQKLKKKLN